MLLEQREKIMEQLSEAGLRANREYWHTCMMNSRLALAEITENFHASNIELSNLASYSNTGISEVKDA